MYNWGMDLLIKNCDLISMAEAREKFEPGMDILVANGKIKKIGKNIEAPEGAEVVDASGKICLPGLINTHAHLSMSVFRETLDGYTLQDWLEKKIWSMEDRMTAEDMYYASLLSFIEMLSTGTVMANDQYFMTENTIEAANKVGVRLQATRTINDVGDCADQRIEELKELIKKYHNKYWNISLNVGIHGLYTTGADTLQKAIAIAEENDLPIHMHFCENGQEVIDNMKMYEGLRPIEVLKKYFAGSRTILAHAVKLEDEDIDELSKMNVSVAHCPVSNMRLGCGIAKVQRMLDKGINVALGTDGQGSGSNLDLFEEMKLAALLQKGGFENVKNMGSYEILKMATINGAKALGVDEKIGSVKEGKEADIILLDLNTVVCQPMGDVFSDIVYNAKGSNVAMTIVNGKIAMRDGKVGGIDVEEVFEKCEKIRERISAGLID